MNARSDLLSCHEQDHSSKTWMDEITRHSFKNSFARKKVAMFKKYTKKSGQNQAQC